MPLLKQGDFASIAENQTEKHMNRTWHLVYTGINMEQALGL